MLRILFRNSLKALVNQIPYSFVNILGLTIGVSSVLMLIIWISVETSFENFHKDKERLYRVAEIIKTPNRVINSASINAPAGPEYKREFPSVENMVRISENKESVVYKDKTISIRVLYTDSTLFDMFSFGLLPETKQIVSNHQRG
jgi:putative ABC transport system permease protein